jgi:hypothetical protein
MMGQKWYILSRMEPNGDTVCVHAYDDAGKAERACADLLDMATLRDHNESAYVVNVLRQTTHGADCPITPGEVYATWKRSLVADFFGIA